MFGQDKQRKEDQKNRSENLQSKNALLAFLRSTILKIDDEQIQESMRNFAYNVESYLPCENKKARVLDERIEDTVRVFFDEIFKIRTSNSLTSAEAELVRKVKIEGNQVIFNLCAEIIETQLIDRNMLMSEKELSKKEINELSDSKRARYLYRKDQAESLEDLWNTQSSILDYLIRLQKNLYEKKCRQVIQEELLKKAKADPANINSYKARYNQLDAEIKNFEQQEKIILSQIEKNNKINEIITATDLEEFIDAKNSAAGGKIIAKIKKYSDRYKKLAGGRRKDDEVTNELFANFDQEKNKNMPNLSSNDAFSSRYEEKLINDSKVTGNTAFDDAFEELKNKK